MIIIAPAAAAAADATLEIRVIAQPWIAQVVGGWCWRTGRQAGMQAMDECILCDDVVFFFFLLAAFAKEN